MREIASGEGRLRRGDSDFATTAAFASDDFAAFEAEAGVDETVGFRFGGESGRFAAGLVRPGFFAAGVAFAEEGLGSFRFPGEGAGFRGGCFLAFDFRVMDDLVRWERGNYVDVFVGLLRDPLNYLSVYEVTHNTGIGFSHGPGRVGSVRDEVLRGRSYRSGGSSRVLPSVRVGEGVRRNRA